MNIPPPQPTAVPVGDSLIVAEGLTKSFDDREVIHSLDLRVERGAILGLIGPSGCGKTTTVRLMTGLLTPTSGSVRVFGTPANHLHADQRAGIGYLPQTPALFPELSLRENLNFHASMYGLPLRRKRRIAELLDWVELSDRASTRVSDASGGMQRRLALAAAFVQDPVLAFLDEPTAGIDPILRTKFWERFHSMSEEGKTLVVTTQYVGEAGECDVVGVLSDGELILLDTPDNLRRAAYQGDVLAVVLDRDPTDAELAHLARQKCVVGICERVEPGHVLVPIGDTQGTRELSAALDALGMTAQRIDQHVVDYDEAFVRIVQRHRESQAALEPDDDSDGNGNGGRK